MLNLESIPTDPFKFTTEIMNETLKARERSFDNLFNANSRNWMLKQYRYTDAMRITIQDLKFLRGPFQVSDQTHKQWLPSKHL